MMNATKEICLTKIRQRSWGTWQVQRINPRPSGRLRISGKVRISLRGGKGGSRGGCNAETAILWSVCSVCPTTLTLPFSSTASPPLSLQLHPEVSSSLSRVLLDAWRPSRFILALSRVSSLGRHGPECVRPSSRRVNFAKIAQGEYWADETAMFAAYTSSIVESRPAPAWGKRNK